MRKSSTLFLQFVLVLIGAGILAWLLWFPQVEGVTANATQFEIYFKDPFLAYIYLASVPFFIGVYQAIKLLNYVRENKTFSLETVRAVRTIRYCAIITAAAIVATDIFLMIHARLYPEPGAVDGPEGAIMLGIIAIFISIVFATAAAVLERVLQNAVDIKSENDLTV
jgi:hypothetical protein